MSASVCLHHDHDVAILFVVNAAVVANGSIARGPFSCILSLNAEHKSEQVEKYRLSLRYDPASNRTQSTFNGKCSTQWDINEILGFKAGHSYNNVKSIFYQIGLLIDSTAPPLRRQIF